MEELNAAHLQQDDSSLGTPRFGATRELGYAGLKVSVDSIYEESNTRLRMPFLIKEIDDMKKDASVAAALRFFKMQLGKVEWYVKPPLGASEKEITRANAINSMMHDMEGSWFEFMMNVLTDIDYGFSVIEKVYKKSIKGQSKFKDGLYGWKKFAPRSQSSYYGWEFTNNGRELSGFIQSLQNLYDSGRYNLLAENAGSTITIPREKFMLFRTDAQNGNPEGTASLKSAWVAWRYAKMIEEQEAIGVGRDLGGLFHLQVPAALMDENASDDTKAAYADIKKTVRNIAIGEQSGLITPSDLDSESKGKLYSAELLSSKGSSSYDTTKIIERYKSQILIALFADMLQMGNNTTGSYALAGSKMDVIATAVEFRLSEIRDVLNSDLIPQTYAMNGWETEEYPTFEFKKLSEPDLNNISSYVYRLVATGALEKTKDLNDFLRENIGLDPQPEDYEFEDSTNTSRSGDGIAKGSLNGTSDGVASEDNSISNKENG